MSVVAQQIRPGRYRHFTGALYEVIGVARHSEVQEDLVVYRALYDDDHQLWVRPMMMFLERVKRDGKEMARFEYVEE